MKRSSRKDQPYLHQRAIKIAGSIVRGGTEHERVFGIQAHVTGYVMPTKITFISFISIIVVMMTRSSFVNRRLCIIGVMAR